MSGEERRAVLLVIDRDDAWLAALIEHLRGVDGLALVRVADAAAALEIPDAPDLILWDIERASRFDFEAHARIIARFPGSDVVVAVGGAGEADVVRLLRAGVTYLCDAREEPESAAVSIRQFIKLSQQVNDSPEGMNVEYHLRNWVEIAAPSEQKFVESLARLVQALAPTTVDARRRRTLGYVLREIGQNAIKWGNAFDREKRVHMSFCILEDRVLLKIEDEGEGFNPADLPDPRGDALGALLRRRAAGKPPGGYGLAIVKGLVDAVLFNAKGNSVVLTLFLDREREHA